VCSRAWRRGGRTGRRGARRRRPPPGEVSDDDIIVHGLIHIYLGPFDPDEKDETLKMLHEQTTEILARVILDLTQTLARSVT
jgi:hypothetical protein